MYYLQSRLLRTHVGPPLSFQTILQNVTGVDELEHVDDRLWKRQCVRDCLVSNNEVLILFILVSGDCRSPLGRRTFHQISDQADRGHQICL